MSSRILWLFLNLMFLFNKLRLRILAKLVSLFIRIVFSAQIPPEVKIGRGTVLGYAGLSIVLHKNTVIGTNCRIGSGVTLGSNNPDVRAPTIGDNSFVATGAKILGGVIVGKNCVIGANSVVLNDVPDNCIAVGVPAKVVKRGIDITLYNETFYEL